MHSFLIVSKDKKTALEYLSRECKKNQINKFDISIHASQKAIGIEDIRNLQRQINLKPMYSKTKTVILETNNGLTLEAQNALLKILEEPPANTVIYITIPNKNLVLPTILSRCKIIELKDKGPELSKDESTQYLNILISLFSSGVGERLKLAQDIAKNKDEVIAEIEKMIIVTRQKLIDSICHSDQAKPEKNLIPQYLNILISLNKTYTVLKTTNVNQRLALENLFLNL